MWKTDTVCSSNLLLTYSNTLWALYNNCTQTSPATFCTLYTSIGRMKPQKCHFELCLYIIQCSLSNIKTVIQILSN